MKFAVPEISWHNRDPVLSVDFQPKSDPPGPQRLASGGADSHVLIWYISITDTGSVNLEVAADLNRHLKAVNVVRWSPSGQYLASGDDESIIFIWKQKTEDTAPTAELGEEVYKESWVIHKTLRGHVEDVLDLCWSTDSSQLVSGSVDNKLVVWDVVRGRSSAVLTDHKGFVQGVAWDPKGQYIATTSSDRVFRTFDAETKKVTSRSSKAVLPLPAEHPLSGARVRLYHDDTLQTYFRRLHFSPDGLLIAVPAGRVEPDSKLDMKPINAVYIYTRYSLKVPACVLPCAEPALAARWSPRRFAPRAGAALPAPARSLLAVATRRALLLYDTQQRRPLALLSNVHYTRLTDLSWSPDGRMLVAASTDGFCSVITFDEGELGEELPDEPAQPAVPEPMDVQTEEQQTEAKQPTDKPKSTPTTNKIDSFMKFKPPSQKAEKSPPKKRKIESVQQKTPVKLDVLMETAMPSWSDNSSSEIIKPQESKADAIKDEIMIIDDSEDIKLVYEETENKSQSPKDTEHKNAVTSDEVKPKDNTTSDSGNLNKDQQSQVSHSECDEDVEKSKLKTSHAESDSLKDSNDKSAKTESKPNNETLQSQSGKPDAGTQSPVSDIKVTTSRSESEFLKQAKVTDVKQPAGQVVASPRPPRRVNFITLSSPKNKKK